MKKDGDQDLDYQTPLDVANYMLNKEAALILGDVRSHSSRRSFPSLIVSNVYVSTLEIDLPSELADNFGADLIFKEFFKILANKTIHVSTKNKAVVA